MAENYIKRANQIISTETVGGTENVHVTIAEATDVTVSDFNKNNYTLAASASAVDIYPGHLSGVALECEIVPTYSDAVGATGYITVNVDGSATALRIGKKAAFTVTSGITVTNPDTNNDVTLEVVYYRES